jgi:hypothetical protein
VAIIYVIAWPLAVAGAIASIISGWWWPGALAGLGFVGVVWSSYQVSRGEPQETGWRYYVYSTPRQMAQSRLMMGGGLADAMRVISASHARPEHSRH